MTIGVRKAERADMPRVLALYQLLAGPYAPDKVLITEDAAWQMLADDPRQHLLVAEYAGRVIGTATLIVIPNIGHGGRPWAGVENVAVAEEYRGRGIGRRLMAALGDLARAHACYKLVLSSNLVRTEAHTFYRRLGWRQSHAGFSLEEQ